MAAHSEQLVAPYVRRIEELSREIGVLRARLDGQAAGHEVAPQAEPWPEGRRWWQKLLGG